MSAADRARLDSALWKLESLVTFGENLATPVHAAEVFDAACEYAEAVAAQEGHTGQVVGVTWATSVWQRLGVDHLRDPR